MTTVMEQTEQDLITRENPAKSEYAKAFNIYMPAATREHNRLLIERQYVKWHDISDTNPYQKAYGEAIYHFDEEHLDAVAGLEAMLLLTEAQRKAIIDEVTKNSFDGHWGDSSIYATDRYLKYGKDVRVARGVDWTNAFDHFMANIRPESVLSPALFQKLDMIGRWKFITPSVSPADNINQLKSFFISAFGNLDLSHPETTELREAIEICNIELQHIQESEENTLQDHKSTDNLDRKTEDKLSSDNESSEEDPEVADVLRRLQQTSNFTVRSGPHGRKEITRVKDYEPDRDPKESKKRDWETDEEDQIREGLIENNTTEVTSQFFTNKERAEGEYLLNEYNRIQAQKREKEQKISKDPPSLITLTPAERREAAKAKKERHFGH